MKQTKISKTAFTKLYYSSTIETMSRKLGVSKTTIYKYIKKLAIKKKGQSQQPKKLIIR